MNLVSRRRNATQPGEISLAHRVVRLWSNTVAELACGTRTLDNSLAAMAAVTTRALMAAELQTSLLTSTSRGPGFSGYGYPSQCAANTSRPRLGRFWLRELRVSRHFSTFYGPSVQTMETRLGARQRRRPPPVHRGRTHAPRLQRPVASEDEASACSELRLGCHPETPVIEPCRFSDPG